MPFKRWTWFSRCLSGELSAMHAAVSVDCLCARGLDGGRLFVGQERGEEIKWYLSDPKKLSRGITTESDAKVTSIISKLFLACGN